MPYSAVQHVDIVEPVILTAAQRKGIIAACIGNFIEWYEFVLYGYFAATLAQLFSPPIQRRRH